jgi:hypothetical protein
MKHYSTKTYGGVDVSIHVFLTWAVAGSEWPALRPGCSTPVDRKNPRYQLDRQVGPQNRSGQRGEGNILAVPGLELHLLAVHSVASRFTEFALPVVSPVKALQIHLSFCGTH